ncbi:unnamed protein product [Durusdinium trenchii]|uniref:Ankyrin repeat domain-containing protein n=1 Tax=Durusdinium trenchii TaxID=1381693 RepID=A0ABP0QXJ9_9DINO
MQGKPMSVLPFTDLVKPPVEHGRGKEFLEELEDEPLGKKLWLAVLEENLGQVVELLAQGADANWRTEHGSVLSAALAAKKAALVAPILEAKASIGEHDVGALSRLFRGEGPASTDTVEILLQPQGDCNA